MRFLLLGGAGYIGGRLLKYLEEQGHDVRITTRSLSNLPSWVDKQNACQVDYHSVDSLAFLLRDREVIIHLAGADQTSAAENPLETLYSGEELSYHLMQAILTCSVRPALIYLSTFHVYGANTYKKITEDRVPFPIHPYSLTKYSSEGIIRMFQYNEKIKALCVRMSNAFGVPAGSEISQWSLVFNDLCRQAVINKQIILNSAGTQKRNFVSLFDCIRAMEFLAINQDQWPDDGLINLGSSLKLSIQEVAFIVAERSEIILGFRPSILIPESESMIDDKEFIFSVERLSSMGFKWLNNLEEEVDNTLILCRDYL